jgi:hypothetical protein
VQNMEIRMTYSRSSDPDQYLTGFGLWLRKIDDFNGLTSSNLNYSQLDLCGCTVSFSCHGVCLSSRSMVLGWFSR